MRQVFIKRNGGDRLILFFGGWGSGPELFRPYPVPADCDFMLCYDYKSLDFDAEILSGYSSIKLIAWSLGVWVASKVVPGYEGLVGKIGECIAVGGTELPVDDRYGIPHIVFEGTLASMSDITLKKFRRRMCGKGLDKFLSLVPGRSAEELTEELSALYDAIKRRSHLSDARTGATEATEKTGTSSALHWTSAYCGENDCIFPYANLECFWKGRLSEADFHHPPVAHYDYGLFGKLISNGISDSEPRSEHPDDDRYGNKSDRKYHWKYDNKSDRKYDKDLIRQRFAKSIDTYPENAVVQTEVAGKMAGMVEKYCGTSFGKVLEVGCGTGIFTGKLLQKSKVNELILNDLCPEVEVCISGFLRDGAVFLPGDAETVDFPDGTDLIVSCSAIQWFSDMNAFLAKAASSLKKGGFLALSSFGEDNFREMSALEMPSLSYWSLTSIEEAAAGLFEKVADGSEYVVQYFDTPMDVLRHLKATGVTGVSRQLWTKDRLERFCADYAGLHSSDGGVSLTYNPIYLILKKI